MAKKQWAKRATLIAWRSGELEVTDECPAGAIAIGYGPRRQLSNAILAIARHAYDGKTLLVPGIPEAATDDDALTALQRFQERVATHLNAKSH